MSKSGIKKVLIVMLVAAGLFIAAIVVTPSLIDLNRYKGVIVEKAQAAINKKIELGDIRVALLGGVGVDLGGCTVYQGLSASDKVIFSCGKLSVRVKLLPLFSKKVEVSQVLLNSPKIVVVRDARGDFNFMPAKSRTISPPEEQKPAAATGKKKGVKKAKEPAPSPASRKEVAAPAGNEALRQPGAAQPGISPAAAGFAVQSISIVNGQFVYRDEMRKRPVEVSIDKLDVAVRGIEEGGDVRFKISGMLNGQGAFKLQGSAGKIPPGYDFGGGLDALRYSVALSLKDCDLNAVIESAGAAVKGLPVMEGPIDLDVSVKGSIAESTCKVTADLQRMQIGFRDIVNKPKDTPLRLSVSGAWKRSSDAELETLSLVFGGSKLTASGTVSRHSRLKLNLTAVADIFLKDLAMVNAVKKVRPDGNLRVDMTVMTRGDGIDLNAVTEKSGDRAALREACRDLEFSLKGIVTDLDAGVFTRMQKGPVELKGPVSADLQAGGSVGKTDISMTCNLDRMSITYPVLFSKASGKPFSATFKASVSDLDRVSIEDLLIAYGTSKLRVTGAIADLDSPDVKLTIGSKLLMSDLSGVKDMQKYDFTGGVSVDLDVLGRVAALDKMDVNGAIDIDHVKFAPPALTRGHVEVDGSLSVKQDLFSLKGLNVTIGQSKLSVNGSIKSLDRPTGTFTAAIDRLNIDELAALFEQRTSGKPSQARNESPRPAAPAETPADSAPPAKQKGRTEVSPVRESAAEAAVTSHKYVDRIDIKGNVAIGELTYHKNALSDIKADIVLKNGVLSVPGWSLRGFDGAASGAATYRLGSPSGEFETVVSFAGVDINRLLSANTRLTDRIFGKLDMKLRVSGSGSTPETVKQRLVGSGTVDIKDGKIASVDILRNLSAISGIIGLDLPNIDDTAFNKLRMSIDIRNGKCSTSDLTMATDQFDMAGDGYFTFDSVLNFNLNLKLTKEFTQRLGSGELQQAMIDQEGRLTLPFTVAGPLDGPPKFSPNWGNIIQRQAQFRLEKMLKDKILPEKTAEPQSSAGAPAQPETGAAPAEGQQKKQSTKEILTDVLIDVLSESMKKGGDGGSGRK
ncbi:MAG TPA: AsmA family protein [bacterium]|nr:AsmA family protein [bacterium]